MTKEERKLRKFIRGCWDGSLIKISEKGKPDAYQNTDEATIGLIIAMRRAVIAEERGRCAEQIDDYLKRCAANGTGAPRVDIVAAIRRGK